MYFHVFCLGLNTINFVFFRINLSDNLFAWNQSDSFSNSLFKESITYVNPSNVLLYQTYKHEVRNLVFFNFNIGILIPAFRQPLI
jgi:hypothetical protein